MDDNTPQPSATPQPPPSPASGASASSQPPPPPMLIPVRLVDGRSPFPVLAVYRLLAVPRPGDLIQIGIQGHRVSYNVSFVNFDPFDDVSHVTLGCLPGDAGGNVSNDGDAKLKERVDDLITTQLQLFDRAEAYSKAMILAGYAGVFGVWSFARDVLTARTTEWVGLLVGLSLLIYVTWEIAAMIRRVTLHNEFNTLIHKTPADFLKTLDEFNQQLRSATLRDVRTWRIVLILTVLFGFAGAFILLYDAAAKLAGLPQWP